MANKEVRFSATFQDKAGNKAAATAYLLIPEAATLTTLQTAFDAFYTTIAAVSAANTVNGEAAIRFPAAVIAGVGFDDSWLGNAAVINYSVNGSTVSWGQAIPAIIDTAVSSGTLNLAETNVAALTTLMTSAVLGGTYTDNTYLPGGLNAVRDGFRANRKHNSNKVKVYP
jgi:hypothetical protein